MTAYSALAPVQTALYETLTADATLAGMVTGVFDYVPEGTAYPYVHVGEATEIPDNTHSGFGRQTVVTLHVWSQHRGFSEALTIAARIIQVLDHAPLTIDGLRHVATRFESSQTLTDPEPPGDIRHVPMTFRVVTSQP